MPKCPKCGSLIKYLLLVLEIYHEEKFSLEEVQTTNNRESLSFKCPFCLNVLFTDQDVAIKFLGGELDGNN